MEDVFANPEAQQSTFDALAFIDGVYNSGSFRFIRIILLIYTVIMVINIILVVIVSDPVNSLKTTLEGQHFSKPPKKKSLKRWEAIAKRLDSDSDAQYKIAVLEADKMTEEILKGIGYSGATVGEMLVSIKPSQLDHYAELEEAHEVRTNIVDDPEFSISQEQARETLDKYEAVLRGLELF
jgi:hypothetical protein